MNRKAISDEIEFVIKSTHSENELNGGTKTEEESIRPVGDRHHGVISETSETDTKNFRRRKRR